MRSTPEHLLFELSNDITLFSTQRKKFLYRAPKMKGPGILYCHTVYTLWREGTYYCNRLTWAPALLRYYVRLYLYFTVAVGWLVVALPTADCRSQPGPQVTGSGFRFAPHLTWLPGSWAEMRFESDRRLLNITDNQSNTSEIGATSLSLVSSLPYNFLLIVLRYSNLPT